MLKNLGLVTCLLVIGVSQSALAQMVVKEEPPMGKMQEGEVLLVNDGSCPPGQIKRVVGGNHVLVGGTKHIERTRRCVRR